MRRMKSAAPRAPIGLMQIESKRIRRRCALDLGHIALDGTAYGCGLSNVEDGIVIVFFLSQICKRDLPTYFSSILPVWPG